jgi:hypothetical protein
LENLKVYLNVSDESIKQSLKEMIEKDYVLTTDDNDCEIYLTDSHIKKSEKAVNMLIANVAKISEFKGQADIDGFNHYVVYNENDFLVERVNQALTRQFAIKKGLKSTESGTIMGVRALILMDNLQNDSGIQLPIVKTYEVRSSKERSKLAEEMEKFFETIEPIVGQQSPTFAQYAVEIQEELLMNAIWDANPKHEKQPRTIPVDLDENEQVVLEWGFNGKDLAISVRDNFGRLNPQIMSKYVKFIFKTGTQESHQLNERDVSAGLGMYMILQRANILSVFISKGKVTDVGVVICLSKKKRAKNQSPKVLDIFHVDK